ncbi:MAG: hypothetical protein K0Q79_3060 [Flavipsychrobacter sp.]|jgi:hypothetical protein|nr:hypothetical protein [Flavipsychrobacter sp.]
MLKRLLRILLIGWSVTSQAQEFNCKVTVRHDKINNVDNAVFTGMEKSLNEFINNRKWSPDDFAATEKIDCNILLNVTGNNVGGNPDAYSATLNIQATRPVYNASYTTNIINFIDKDIVFQYSLAIPLYFDDNQVVGTVPLASNLSAVVAFYAYIVLALDYDSFSPNGGTNFLKKAQNVVNNAPEGKGISGWKAMESNKNRYWLADQLLSPRFSEVRNFWYMMHREGLDSMTQKPADARGKILTNLRKLYNVNRENPNSILLQFFFNAKTDEMQHFLAQAPKQERAQYITLLTAMDVPNAAKYNAYR